MHVFLLTIIPLVYFVNEYLCHDRKLDREQLFCIFAGLVIVCIYTLIDFFAIGSNHVWINTLSSVWVHYLVSETLIPVIVCVLPVFLAKDPFRVKVQLLFPVMAAFFAVFVPYKVISQEISPDGFMLICYPLMMAAMLFDIDTAASVFDEGRNLSSLLWLRCLVAGIVVIAGILLPPAFTAVWFLNRVDAGTWILIGLFLLFSAGLRVVTELFLKTPESE